MKDVFIRGSMKILMTVVLYQRNGSYKAHASDLTKKGSRAKMSWEGRPSEISISRISCEDVVGGAQELAEASIFHTNHGRGH